MNEKGRFRGKTVGVFLGGESSEREGSLRTGGAAASALRRGGDPRRCGAPAGPPRGAGPGFGGGGPPRPRPAGVRLPPRGETGPGRIHGGGQGRPGSRGGGGRRGRSGGGGDPRRGR